MEKSQPIGPGAIGNDNVCVARDSATAGSPLAQFLADQSWRDSAHVLHLDLRGSNPPIVDSMRALRPVSTLQGAQLLPAPGRYGSSGHFLGAVDLVVEAWAAGLARPVRLTIALGHQSQSRVLAWGDTLTVWHFDDKSGRIDPTLRVSVSAPSAIQPTTAPPTIAENLPPIRALHRLASASSV